MKKKSLIIIIAALAAVAIGVLIVLFAIRHPSKPSQPKPPAQPATPDAPSIPGPPSAPPEPATSDVSVPAQAEELDLSEAFSEFPAHFISHNGGPPTEGSTYLHATMEISRDGKISGTFFSNMDTGDNAEQKSDWTGSILDGKLYRTASGSYGFKVNDIRYEKEPGTSETINGKTVYYVSGFGLDTAADNLMELYLPGYAIDDILPATSGMDIRQFLSMMFKNGEAQTLDCCLIKGNEDSCYVSITEEESRMDPPQQPDQPEQPMQPQQPNRSYNRQSSRLLPFFKR